MSTKAPSRPEPTLLDIPRYRAMLETGIPARAVREFGGAPHMPLAPVDFPTPEEARKLGLPPTGWYDYGTGRVAVVVDRAVPPAEAALPHAGRAAARARRLRLQYERLCFIRLHEEGHRFWNYTPAQCGARDRIDCLILNFLSDCTNEQRAGLTSLWARRLVRRGRQIVWQELLEACNVRPASLARAVRAGGGGGVLPPLGRSPLWAACFLSLRAHTYLAAYGWKLLRRASNGRLSAATAWAKLEAVLGAPPVELADDWPRAWHHFWEAWRTPNQMIHMEHAAAIRALFPDPVEDPAPSIESLDAHPGDSGERADGPAAEDPGTPRPSAPPSPGTGPADSGPEAAPPARGASTGSEDDGGAGGASAGDDVDFDDARDEEPAEPGETDDDFADEIEALTAPAPVWDPGASGTCSPPRPLYPTDGAPLLAAARAGAGDFANWLRAARRPKTRSYTTRGRVAARRVARDPRHPEPFRRKTGLDVGIPPELDLGMMLDDSGSMRGTKIAQAALAALTVAVAAETEGLSYVVVTSRHEVHVAGDGIPLHRAAGLLAAIDPPGCDGDNYATTLPSFLAKFERRRASDKVAIVVTDGRPDCPDALAEVVVAARTRGMIVIGLLLRAPDADDQVAVAGMRSIFGDRDLSLSSVDRFARDLATAISSAIARAAGH